MSKSDTDLEEGGLPTPREAKEEAPDCGAYIRADTHIENGLVVLGTAVDGSPHVSISLDSGAGVQDSAISLSFDPDTARVLAEMLERRADYAEEYAEAARDGALAE